MENINIEKISYNIIEQFEKLGISKDNLLILSIIFFLIIENNTDYILIILLLALCLS